MKKYVIALDQGTTSSRAIIFDKDQNILDISQKEFTQIYPHEGWVEHNPMEIWSSQYGVLQEVLAKSNITQEEIAAIGITNQRETTIVWDKYTGEPIIKPSHFFSFSIKILTSSFKTQYPFKIQHSHPIQKFIL